ncbi:MAG TPA: hypothetical protein PKA64_25365, partial [Myxococcota bacterium]|nr:hypothetical protein [Myxococcota bacterium]
MNAPPEDEPTPTWTARLASVAGQIGVLLVALVVVGHLRAPDLPDLAPPLRLATLDGATVDLAGLRGGPVL